MANEGFWQNQTPFTIDNLNAALIQRGTVSSRPSPGQAGRSYFATDENIFYRDTGTAWEVILRGTVVATIGVRSNRPSAGFVGRLYYANDENILYQDTGTDWVPISGTEGVRSGPLSARPAAPDIGNFYYASDKNTLYQFVGDVMYMTGLDRDRLYEVNRYTGAVYEHGQVLDRDTGLGVSNNGFSSIGDVLYMCGNEVLYEVDIDNGIASPVGSATRWGLSASEIAYMNGLARLGTVLYGCGGTTTQVGGAYLYRVDPTRGTATVIGSSLNGVSRPFGLAGHNATNLMYVSDASTNLYSVTTDGVVTTIGSGLGLGGHSASGLTFIGDTLYAVVDRRGGGIGGVGLYSVDTATAVATPVGTVGNGFGVGETRPRGLGTYPSQWRVIATADLVDRGTVRPTSNQVYTGTAGSALPGTATNNAYFLDTDTLANRGTLYQGDGTNWNSVTGAIGAYFYASTGNALYRWNGYEWYRIYHTENGLYSVIQDGVALSRDYYYNTSSNALSEWNSETSSWTDVPSNRLWYGDDVPSSSLIYYFYNTSANHLYQFSSALTGQVPLTRITAVSEGNAFPEAPSANDYFFNTDDNSLHQWDAGANPAAWVAIPSSRLWYDDNTNGYFYFYNTITMMAHSYRGAPYSAWGNGFAVLEGDNTGNARQTNVDYFYVVDTRPEAERVNPDTLYQWDANYREWNLVGSPVPTSLHNGSLFFDIRNNRLQQYQYRQWTDISGNDLVRFGGDANRLSTGNRVGDYYFSTDDNKMYQWDGVDWNDISRNRLISVGNFRVRPTASALLSGDYYFADDRGVLYQCRYNAGDSAWEWQQVLRGQFDYNLFISNPGAGTWTVPIYLYSVRVILIGGGAHSNFQVVGGRAISGAGGGGGGAVIRDLSVVWGETYNYFVGNIGSSGEDTTFGGFLTAQGGQGSRGGDGADTRGNTVTGLTAGGSTFYGGGNGSSYDNSILRGTSTFGGNGGSLNLNNDIARYGDGGGYDRSGRSVAARGGYLNIIGITSGP